ncbi:S26 family signal peptidase [Arthrobacter sp. Soil736]|nr:S26 family signal peptidase [Arthrobacter sp. Soil736]
MDTGGQRGSRRPSEAAERHGGPGLGAAGGVASLLLMVLVFAALALVIVPQATGYRTYTVATNSMAPKYPAGTFLAVKPVAFSELKSGDIVTFQPNPERPQVETQRVVGFGITQSGEKTLITKGDNNGVTSPAPVHATQIRGRLFYEVPFVGSVADALGNADRGLWTSVAAAGLIGFGALFTVRALRRRRRAGG